MKAQSAGSGCPRNVVLKMQILYYAPYEIHWAFKSWQLNSGLHRKAEQACGRAQRLISAAALHTAFGKAEELSWYMG